MSTVPISTVRRLRVRGRVQGVGFRWFVRETARSLDLAGWVQNEASGEVLLEVGGAPDQLASLAAAVTQGPVGARVDAVVDEPAAAAVVDDLPRPFSVRR